MRFKFHGLNTEDFGAWVKKVKGGEGALNRAGYLELEKPSERQPVKHYGGVAPDLYDAILNRCVASGTICIKQMMAMDTHRMLSVADVDHFTPRGQRADAKTLLAQGYLAEICTADGAAVPLISKAVSRIEWTKP